MIERRGLGRCLDVVLLEWGSENRILPETMFIIFENLWGLLNCLVSASGLC
jgi:hypothetical protein